MAVHMRLALLALLVAAGSARANVLRFDGVRELDFENTELHVNVMAGIGLSTLLLFGGMWLIRHPRGRAVYWVVLGSFLGAVGWFFPFFRGDNIGEMLLVFGLMAVGWGCFRLLSVKQSVVGKNLLYLALAAAGAAVLILAVGQMKWKVPQWLQDRWHQRHEELQRRQQEASSPPPDKKPEPSSKPSE
jgi:hypothetical protein